jgi:hypothetical protein
VTDGWTRLLMLAAVAGLTGCKGFTPTVRRTMSWNAQCPEDKIEVKELRNGVYQATGCGKTGTFACWWPDGGNRTCIQQGVPAPKQLPGTGTGW